MLNLDINQAVDHGQAIEEILADNHMSRAGRSFKVYVDMGKVKELHDELILVAQQGGSTKTPEHIKLDQVWSHLTNQVAPFNKRQLSASGRSVPVYPVELIGCDNLEGVKQGEAPANPVIAGDPSQKGRRGRRPNTQGFYGRTQREQVSAPPAQFNQPAEAAGSPMS